jgi:hypothetical protein
MAQYANMAHFLLTFGALREITKNTHHIKAKIQQFKSRGSYGSTKTGL